MYYASTTTGAGHHYELWACELEEALTANGEGTFVSDESGLKVQTCKASLS